MKLQDLLYIHGFANIEWQISKESHIELQKYFLKDIFEEIIKYCYHALDNFDFTNDLNNITLIVDFPEDEDVIVNRLISTSMPKVFDCQIMGSSTRLEIAYGSALNLNENTLFVSPGCIRYRKITIYKYHEINELRMDKDKYNKIMEDRMKEEKKQLLSYNYLSHIFFINSKSFRKIIEL